jgi:hypothetical protein
VASFVYVLPFGRGRRFGGGITKKADAVVGGWQVNGIATFQKGFPITITAADSGGVLDSFGTNRANLVGDPGAGAIGTIYSWFNKAAFAQPAPGVSGNSGRNILRAPGINNFDLSLFKNVALTEWLRFQFRFNEDGRIDLYVANDTGANYLYRNNGDGTFSEIGLMSGAALSEDGKAQASMGVAIGDYDHRGRWNLFVTNFSDEYNAFYRQEKGFAFTDVSYATQTGRASLPYVGWGCGFFDYDNDGWLDLMVVNGHVYPQLATAKLKIAYAQRKLFYRNNRNGAFAEIGAEAGPAMNEPSVSRGAAFGDLDNDGDVDVIINNLDGAPTILRNDGGDRNNFLALELIGGKSNRDAYGARVKVIAGDLVQIDEKRSGGSYLSQNDTRLHFGLERRAIVDAVEVRWPSGVTQKFVNLPVNSFIRIKEGSPAYNPIPYRKIQ